MACASNPGICILQGNVLVGRDASKQYVICSLIEQNVRECLSGATFAWQ